VSQQVQRHDPIPALRKISREWQVHTLGKQKTVEKDHGARPGSVLRVGEAVPVVVESRHLLERNEALGWGNNQPWG